MNNTTDLKLVINNITTENLTSSYLEEILEREYKNNIQDYLLDHINNKDGGPQINNFKISRITFDNNSLKGKFRLDFQIDRQYCCSDIDSCSQDYLDFNFTLDNETLITTATYFDWTMNN